ncbi:uncharacterized protein TNCV_2945771 [Trichonephila clavipes]|nr:uncharacterized protein TNCV_2945771 [Trichonephila clavipes]
MQQAIWAIFLHKLSTDEKPQHMDFVPLIQIRGANLKAELLGRLIITKIVYLWMLWEIVFRDLANPELLKKCLHGGTQNPNESVNNVIWSRVPKKTFVQLEVLSLGTYDAVSSFNMGNVSKLEILRKCVLSLVITRYRRWSASTNRGCYEQNTIVYKTKEVRKEKDLKGRKKMMSY